MTIHSLSGQESSTADSLTQILQTAREDTAKVILLNDLAWELMYDQPEVAKKYLYNSITLAGQLNYLNGKGQAFNNLGVLEIIHGNIEAATKNHQTALEIRKQTNDKKGMASSYNNIALLMEEKGNLVAAMENLSRSLRIREALRDTTRIARVLYNMSYVHESMGNYPEALDYIYRFLELAKTVNEQSDILIAYNLIGNIKSELEQFEEAHDNYKKALDICLILNDEEQLAIVYNNLGNTLDDLGERNYKDEKFGIALPQLNQALDYHFKSLTLRKKEKDETGKGDSYNNIGLVHKNLGSYFVDSKQQDSAAIHFERALKFLNQSLAIRQSLNDQHGIMEVYNGIGDVRRRQEKYEEALDYTQRYLDIAQELESHKFIQSAYKDLSRVYAKLDQYKKAYKYRKKYDEKRYERLDEDRITQMNRREALYDNIEKEFELDKKEKEIQLQNAQLSQAALLRNSLLGGALGLFVVALLLYNRYRIKHKANINLEEKNKIIEAERERSESLLLNILPEETAKELKQHGKAKARKYESVTVLFTDIQSFTKIAEQMAPEMVVHQLDTCFRAFDKITEKYGIEKIKTIGDAYMCAGGLPLPNITHPKDVVQAALEMQRFMHTFNKQKQLEGIPPFEIRIGIHTGPVVAGIVGDKKFAYDIWGDTVNLAARMESGGQPGKVNISRATYQLVKDDFYCIPRGKIEVKNKGEVFMYFAEPLHIKVT